MDLASDLGKLIWESTDWTGEWYPNLSEYSALVII